jgi:hypothetical protein
MQESHNAHQRPSNGFGRDDEENRRRHPAFSFPNPPAFQWPCFLLVSCRYQAFIIYLHITPLLVLLLPSSAPQTQVAATDTTLLSPTPPSHKSHAGLQYLRVGLCPPLRRACLGVLAYQPARFQGELGRRRRGWTEREKINVMMVRLGVTREERRSSPLSLCLSSLQTTVYDFQRTPAENM